MHINHTPQNAPHPPNVETVIKLTRTRPYGQMRQSGQATHEILARTVPFTQI